MADRLDWIGAEIAGFPFSNRRCRVPQSPWYRTKEARAGAFLVCAMREIARDRRLQVELFPFKYHKGRPHVGARLQATQQAGRWTHVLMSHQKVSTLCSF